MVLYKNGDTSAIVDASDLYASTKTGTIGGLLKFPASRMLVGAHKPFGRSRFEIMVKFESGNGKKIWVGTSHNSKTKKKI